MTISFASFSLSPLCLLSPCDLLPPCFTSEKITPPSDINQPCKTRCNNKGTNHDIKSEKATKLEEKGPKIWKKRLRNIPTVTSPAKSPC